jgi:toxin FitB
MTGFLLDTNILSEFNRRGAPDYRVDQWLTAADPKSLYAGVITFAEILFGSELLPPGRRRSQLEQWLIHDLHTWFAGRLLPVDEPIGNRWAALTGATSTQGQTASQF